jgi:hypothetical protein
MTRGVCLIESGGWALLSGVVVAMILAAASSATAQAAPRSEWDIEDPRAPTTLLEFTATEGTWISVDVAPDGRTIVFDLLGHLYEMPIGGGEARALTEGRSWNMFPRYSPDGSRIAFTSDRAGSDDIWVLERGTGSLRNVSEHPRNVYRPSWSKDGRYLYAAGFQDAPGGLARGLRYNLSGGHQEIVEIGPPVGQFQESPRLRAILFERVAEPFPTTRRAGIRSYDLETGEISAYLDRRGGAFTPTLSPDGSALAYLHREDQETVLVVRDLESLEERTVLRGLDRDRQETPFHLYGAAPNMSWTPDGRELVLAVGGGIRAVNVESGAVREIPFRAPVRRRLNQTIRFPPDIPVETAQTRLHRWATRTPAGVLSEALGDLWLRDDAGSRNITNSPEHETSPVYDPATRTVYHAAWSDDGLGGLRALSLDGDREPVVLTDVPAPYGSLALSPDGRMLAALRGAGSVRTGGLLQRQTEFELIILHLQDGIAPRSPARVVARVGWRAISGANHAALRPPTVVFDPDGTHIWFTAFVGDTLALKRIRRDGLDERTTHLFPHATRVVPSPDLKWIAFREYHRHFVSPNDWLGKTLRLSAEDGQGFAKRVDQEDGLHLSWSHDASTLQWTRGATLHEKALSAVLRGAALESGSGESSESLRTPISVEFDVARPAGALALTGVRVLPMDADRRTLENATVLVRDGRIVAVGPDVAVPADATVLDLAGHTVIPGLVDAHAHPYHWPSPLNVVEQRPFPQWSALAHGVTTQYEVYGTDRKDVWISDMVRAGRIVGPRQFTTGTPIFGMRNLRPKLYRPIASYEDALEHVRYNAALGADAIKDYVVMNRRDRHMLATAARETGVNVLAETGADLAMNLTQIIDGETGLEHTPGPTPLRDDVIQLLRASDVGITPTLLVVYDGPAGEGHFHTSERVWEDEKLLRFVRKEDLLRTRRPTWHWPDDRYAPTMAAAMKRLWDAGISIQVGGHGQMDGLDMHWEMELLSQGGFTPLEAIEAATIRGARYHGLDHLLGSLEPGKLADLVVLSADPRQDIRNSRSIRYVMRNGFLYDGDTLDPVWPERGEAGAMYFRRGGR